MVEEQEEENEEEEEERVAEEGLGGVQGPSSFLYVFVAAQSTSGTWLGPGAQIRDVAIFSTRSGISRRSDLHIHA